VKFPKNVLVSNQHLLDVGLESETKEVSVCVCVRVCVCVCAV